MNVTSRSPLLVFAHASGRQERRRSSQSGDIPGIDDLQSYSSAGPTPRGVGLNATISGTVPNALLVFKVVPLHWDRLANPRLKDTIPREGCFSCEQPTERAAEIQA